MSAEKREPGFYWVKYDGLWQVAEWCIPEEYLQLPGYWSMSGSDINLGTRNIGEIDERKIINPNE